MATSVSAVIADRKHSVIPPALFNACFALVVINVCYFPVAYFSGMWIWEKSGLGILPVSSMCGGGARPVSIAIPPLPLVGASRSWADLRRLVRVSPAVGPGTTHAPFLLLWRS